MSRVDVVIPCYKYAHYLEGCVESVLRQDGVDARVLIIDDCSPDDTPRVAARLAANDARVEYRRHAINLGHIATYNEGLLGRAIGDYCMLLSADDKLLPGALRRATRVMDERPDVAFVHGLETRDVTPPAAQDRPSDDVDAVIVSGQQFVEAMCRKGGNTVSTPTVVVRTSVQQKVGGYRKELPHSGDMEMWLRCAAHGAVGFVNQPQAFYRVHDTNMSTAYYAAGIQDLRQQQAAFDSFFAEYGNTIPGADGLRQMAMHGLAERSFWSASCYFDQRRRRDCDECLEYASMLYPRLRRSPAWWRMTAKRAIGPTVWSAVRPLVGRLRRREPRTPALSV
jgi:glycosyltransferase involved in cell wall biosynthesis